MKTLKTEFEKNGFYFIQVQRSGRVAIYGKRKSWGLVGYEVVIIQHSNDRVLDGREIEGGERYPSSESWGTHGWTYGPSEWDRVEAKFNELCARDNASCSKAV